ncbi:hypothetical protein [Mangrovicoccus algicola]|uniref:RcnB family protein n=1 Tax=Mangrovicoccus algicola TaxID=2771008 RepID=A0A8J6YZ46_9RHOB|nr:hypothetical protein [Mangrovicoccus algicola]MBE3640477.1 hypothetical protein [Mangrovicoccus algicola]
MRTSFAFAAGAVMAALNLAQPVLAQPQQPGSAQQQDSCGRDRDSQTCAHSQARPAPGARNEGAREEGARKEDGRQQGGPDRARGQDQGQARGEGGRPGEAARAPSRQVAQSAPARPAPKPGDSARGGRPVTPGPDGRLQAPPKGQEYRVIDDRVVRVDSQTLKVLAVVGLASVLLAN